MLLKMQVLWYVKQCRLTSGKDCSVFVAIVKESIHLGLLDPEGNCTMFLWTPVSTPH
jgi:hypothetical protein